MADEHHHPLALLDFVSGAPLPRSASGAFTAGSVCGEVHAVLLEADPAEMGSRLARLIRLGQ